MIWQCVWNFSRGSCKNTVLINTRHQRVIGCSINICAPIQRDQDTNWHLIRLRQLHISAQQQALVITLECTAAKQEKRRLKRRRERWEATKPMTPPPQDYADLPSDREVRLTTESQEELLQKPIEQPADGRVIKVAIIGRTNAGKSTLANKLLNWKISSVSNKPNTTRNRTLGVLTRENRQIIFLDTPGMITPEKRKKHYMERSLLTDPHSTLFEADIIMVVVDADCVWGRHSLDPDINKVLHLHRDKKAILIMNKVDLQRDKQDLLHSIRILTAGVVNSRTDFFKPQKLSKKKEEVKLRSLMDQVEAEWKSAHGQTSEQNDNNGDPHETVDTVPASDKNKENIPSSQDSSMNLDQCTNCAILGDENPIIEDESLTNQSTENKIFETNRTLKDANDTDEVLNDKSNTIPDVNEVFNEETEKKLEQLLEKDDNLEQLNDTDTPEALPINVRPVPHPFEFDTKDASERERLSNARKWHGYYYSDLKEIGDKIAEKKGYDGFERVFSVSAHTGLAVDEIREYLFESTQPGDWLFNQSVVTDSDPKLLALHCAKEALLENCQERLPYVVDIEIMQWNFGESNEWQIEYRFICPTNHDKAQLLRNKAELLVQVIQHIKQELMNIFKTEVFVKVRVDVQDQAPRNKWVSKKQKERNKHRDRKYRAS